MFTRALTLLVGVATILAVFALAPAPTLFVGKAIAGTTAPPPPPRPKCEWTSKGIKCNF